MKETIIREIETKRDKFRSEILSRFFKTGKGQYGEGDIFWGLTVPLSRKIAIKYKDLPKKEVSLLLKNRVHEVRLIGLLILVQKYKKGIEKEKKEIVDFYLKNTKYINNWDLVDLSAHHILGDYLYNYSSKKITEEILFKLAKSKKLWEQRISMVSTFAFIRKGDIRWTMILAKMFLGHSHDLMHKASGWMLREAGKRDAIQLCKFLDKNISKMPRTMLRYSIEKFPEHIRKEYLKR